MNMRNKFLSFISIVIALCAVATGMEKFNINNATPDQLITLPLTENQILNIENYIYSRGYFDNVYDLLAVEGITAEDVKAIKPYIIVQLPVLSEFIKGQKTSSYKVNQWLTAEGSTEGLSEVWLDRYYEPRDVNKMSYDELVSLPNLSPIDAVAVIKQQQRGPIKGTFELRNAPGISYYGYRNLIDFVRFSSDKNAKPELHTRFSSLIRTVPVTTNPEYEGAIIPFSSPDRPEIFRKISTTYGEHIKGGYVFHRNMGEQDGIYIEKLSLSVENVQLSRNLRLDRLVLGNFTASFGQSVIMETTDHFSPRRTGFRFTKQARGIFPDLTRTTQYVMKGVGVQLSNDLFRLSLFGSKHPRDAIIGPDVVSSDSVFVDGVFSHTVSDTLPSFSTLIVMQPRLPWGVFGSPPPDRPRVFSSIEDSLNYIEAYEDWDVRNKLYGPMTSSVEEMTWGGNIRFTPVTGLNIGFTFYESLYDKVLDPNVILTITGGEDDYNPGIDAQDYDDYSGDVFIGQYMTNSADPEIAAMYASSGESSLWSDALSYRRVSGFDFLYVIGNMAFQGEYGELSSDNRILSFGDDPHAMVLNLYTQFNNFNFLAVYRDYDLEFDNPYQRSFSNYQRYKTTIFEDHYWLEDPAFSYLYSGNPQPQSERGFFLSSRYQFHRSFVGTLNWDTWTRKADEAKYFRTVASLDWRPAFNFRIKLRQKWQARGSFDLMHPSPFESLETRLTMRLRLSNFDSMEILYSRGYTTFSPRPRLTDNPVGGDMTVGDIGKPVDVLGIGFIHNFDQHLTVKFGSFIMGAEGFLWYFEDTDFRIFDSKGGLVHKWISFTFHPSDYLNIGFKVTHTSDNTFTRVTEGQTSVGNWISNPTENGEATDFRLQVDFGI